jgi:hypothetical protein
MCAADVLVCPSFEVMEQTGRGLQTTNRQNRRGFDLRKKETQLRTHRPTHQSLVVGIGDGNVILTGMALYIFSDAHLGCGTPTDEATKVARISELLAKVRADGDRLVILGDLFDFWFEYKYTMPESRSTMSAEIMISGWVTFSRRNSAFRFIAILWISNTQTRKCT